MQPGYYNIDIFSKFGTFSFSWCRDLISGLDLFCWLVGCLAFGDKVSRSLGWSQTHYIAKVELYLALDPLASTSQVLEAQACATITDLINGIFMVFLGAWAVQNEGSLTI